MAVPAHLQPVIRFEGHELDVRTRELRRNGTKIDLQEQPFLILTTLLERPGELITRDHLKKKLWPEDTFVDFDRSLNKAVNRLREALGDSSESPQFIETLPRRGYRFIGKVDLHERGTIEPEVTESAPNNANTQVGGRLAARAWSGLAVLFSAACLLFLVGLRGTVGPLPQVTGVAALTNDGMAKTSLVTDGSRLYFAESRDERWYLTETSVNGGESERIETPFTDPYVYDFSSTRSELLVGGDIRAKHRELWAVPIPAGAPRRIGDILVHSAVWAPDGAHIVYTNDHDLWTVKSDGTESRKLATLPGFPNSLRFSPSGDTIRFTVMDPAQGSLALWDVGNNGENPRRVLPNASSSIHYCCGVWTAEGRSYFAVNWLINRQLGQDIWLIRKRAGRLRGWSEPVRLTNGPIDFTEMAASADGSQIYALGTQARAELVKYSAATGAFQPFLGGISATDVDVSRDGQWVTYVAYPEFTLWRSRIDGSEKRQLTFPPMEAFLPRWSPDGTKIVFTDLQPGRKTRMYLVSREGGALEAVLPDDPFNQIDPTWPPDGRSIVFARSHLDPDLAIFEVKLGTRELMKIPDSQARTSPRVSPDGRYIAALSRDWTKAFVFDRVKGSWTELASAKGLGYPSWSHDSKTLFLRAVGHKVIGVNVESRQLQVIATLDGFAEPATSWTGVTAEDEILLHRDRSTQEIYRLTLKSE